MQLNLPEITYLIGDERILSDIRSGRTDIPFSDNRIDFLNRLSRNILENSESRQYPDVVTFAFFCRRANMEKQRERFALCDSSSVRFGRGVVFHIAPSNVAVNYAYSFASGFITGNANVVRIPSKQFRQVDIINKAVEKTLSEFPDLRGSVCFVRYGREKTVNDCISSLCDVRVIWGGDRTIAEIRQSPLRPRASEITFADRFSICVIDADEYLRIDNKERTAVDFYNDTYLTDQNACTSPRIVFWIGREKERAKSIFWDLLYKKAMQSYTYQSIYGVNKLTSMYMLAAKENGVRLISSRDNLLVRVQIEEINEKLEEYRDSCGYFLEHDLVSIEEIAPLCSEKLQTISYIGDAEMFRPLLECGINGVDRIVPVGKTMDFDFIWDGYNLCERLTRRIAIKAYN